MIKSIALSMAAATAAALASSIIAAAADMTPKATLMTAGKALELEIGDQHTISYFQPASDGCSLTVVIAAGQTGEGGQEAHGTRINLPIAPGKTVRIDGTRVARRHKVMRGGDLAIEIVILTAHDEILPVLRHVPAGEAKIVE